MGIQVDFGPELGLGMVDFGDMPEEQVRATIREQGPQLRANLISRRQQELAAEPVPEFVSEAASNRGRVTSAGQSAMRGGGVASGGTVSGFARLLESLGPYLSAGSDNEQVSEYGLQEIERRRGMDPARREAEIQQDPIYQAGQELSSGAREAYQPNPAYAGEFLTDTLPGSAGAMVPTVASSIAGGPIGPLLAALQYGSSAGQSAAEEAIAAGRPDLAQQAFAVNAPIGAVTEGVLGAAANLGRLRNLGGGSVVGKVARTALSEAAQEGLEQVGGNLAARGIGYDPNRGVFEGVPESMAAGALLGGGMGGAAVGVDRAGRLVGRGVDAIGNAIEARNFDLGPLRSSDVPLAPPPEFSRQAEVRQAASVAIATLDQQIAQANPVSPLEANTLVADNAARKMEVLAKYLEAQRAAAVPPPPRMAPAVMAPDAGVGQFLQPSGQTPFDQLIGANRNQEARRARVAAGLEAPQAPEVSFTRPITQDEAQSGIAQAVQPEAFTPFDEALRRLPPLRIPLPPEIAQVYSTADKVAQDYLSGADVDPAVLAQLDQISAQIIPQIDNRIRAAFEARVPVAQIEPLLRVSERLGAFVKEYANEKAARSLQEEDRYQKWLASASQPARVQPQAAPVERPLSGLVQTESTTSTTSPVDQFILNRQPATQDALFVQEPGLGLLGSEASQPELQVGLPQVGQGDAQVPAEGQVQEKAVATAKYTPEQLQNLARNIRNYGWDPAEFGLTAEDVDRLSPPKATEAAQPANPTVTSGQKVVRYVVEGKGGLMNRDAFDISKLTDSQVGKLEELLTYGLQQPRGVPGGAVFYFTEAGEEANKKLLALLKKAATGRVVRTTHSAQDTPLWVSADGQVAFEGEQPKFGRRQPAKSATQEPEAKTDFDARRVKWADSPIIQEALNLTDEEAQIVVANDSKITAEREPVEDEDTGEMVIPERSVKQAAPKDIGAPTWKTELARFAAEIADYIYNGAGGQMEDMKRNDRFQEYHDRVKDAVMRSVVKYFDEDGGRVDWKFANAWRRATHKKYGVVRREINEIRKTLKAQDIKTRVPTEVTTEEGETLDITDTLQAKKASETQAKSAQLNSELGAFVAENGLDEDASTALLIRVARERNSAQLTEEMLDAIDPDRRLESMSRTDMIEGYFQQLLPSIRDILYSLNGPVLIPITQADAQAAVTEAFGELPNVRVINDPSAVAPNGESAVGAAAWIDLSTGQITVNAAFIESKDRAVMAVMEEGVHAVWNDPAVKAAWDAVKARINQAKIAAQIARGYSAEVAREEAAVAEVLDYIEQNRKGGTIGEFLANLWTKLKELLVVGNEYDAQRNQIIQRALQALKATPAVNAQQDAEYMAAVERGDTATAQRMVDEAAKRAGYTVGPVYHGTKGKRKGQFPFTVFDTARKGDLTSQAGTPAGSYFAESKRYADGAALYASNMGRSGRPIVGTFYLRNDTKRTPGVETAVEYYAESPSQIKSADPITRDDAGNVIPLSKRFSSASNDIRFSRGNGLFLSRAEASEAIGKAQQVGGDVGTIAQTAQIQGELIPRSIVSDVEALGNSANRVEKLAARILSPLKSIGDLADQTWLAPFTRFNPSARMASDGGSAAEIAAEAVVRADLAIRAKQRSVKEKLVRAEAALMEAIDNLPKAVVADSDATMNRIEGDALIEQMDMALANELKVARSADVPDALAEAAIIRASRALGEARKDIGSGIGSALNAIARELPAQLTTEPAILNWIGQRLADKSQPRIMSEAVEQFLTTRLPGSRTIPLQRVELAPLMARLRKLNDIKEQAKTELEQFKKDFHGGATTKTGKGKAVTMRAFGKRFANFQEKYKAALALSRELNAKAARAQDYYDALAIADEKFTQATESISYREKLKNAVEISNAGSGSLKILLGDNGQLNGTISIPNPISKQIEVVDLSPMRFKRLETQTKLNKLAEAHEIALGDIETDPYDRVQLARNLSQIRRMQDAGIKAGAYIVDLVPEQVPIFGGMSYIPLSRIHHDAPWFGKRLSSPNNVVTWVSGAAGKQAAGIMAATDIAAAQLERLRSDSNRSNPSQDKINRTTEAAIEAHGLDPQNPESQKLISDHFSTIISQAQRPEQRQFRVGDFNPANDLPVLKEDIEAVEAQKQWGTAVYKVGQRAKPNSIGRNIAERPAQQSEVISGKSITRIAADYALKMPRQASISTLPVVRDWSTAMNEAQKRQILEDNFDLLVVGMVMETDPDFTTRFSNEDREIFASAIADGRAGNLPFNDVNSFTQWWGTRRAAANGTTVAEEVLIAEGKLYSIVDGFMRDFAEYAGVGEKSQMTVEDREKRNTPDSLMTIASADNQFTRPRGKLVAPSTLYSYDVTGIAAQESMKTNLLNVFHYEHIKAWTNVKSALKSAMETWDRRKKEMVAKGMRERDAIRKLQLESRKGSASIRNEADYATLRNTVGHIEAMVAELTRSATERLAVPEDAPVVRSGKSLVGLAGASLLASPGPTINNLTGGAYGSALIGSWLNRTSTLASGLEALRRSTRNSVGRILHAAAGKMGWFDGWLKSNGWAANFFADMVATATYQRQLAEDALTVDSPDTASLVEMRLKLPGSGGVVDPGRSDHLVTWLLNQLQSGMGIQKLKSITPQWMHKTINGMAKIPVAATEYTKRIAPAAFDREINATTGAMYREWVDNPAIKKALFDHWSRKEALGGSWNDPANPDFQFGRDDLGEILPDQSRKLLADVLAPLGLWSASPWTGTTGRRSCLQPTVSLSPCSPRIRLTSLPSRC
jgi:hypothetical protein